MLTSLTALLECYPEHDTVIATWCRGVLPLVLDPEAKVQERVIEVRHLGVRCGEVYRNIIMIIIE